MNNVDHQLYQQVSQELQARENIEWIGQPQPGGYAAGSLKIMLFAIPWTAFAVFWIAGAAGFKIPDFKEGFDFFPLFGLPFLLIGFGMMLRPLFDYFKAHKIVYAITNKRVMIIQFGSRKKIRSYDLSGIGPVTRVEKVDGSGSLYFSIENHGASNRSRLIRAGFKAIPQVKLVESYLRVKETTP